jgi:hypothetical protein
VSFHREEPPRTAYWSARSSGSGSEVVAISSA